MDVSAADHGRTKTPGRGQVSRRGASVHSALDAAEGFVSAQSLHDALIDRGVPASLATVYRHLNALVDAGAADTVTHDGRQLFRTCHSIRDHLHLICQECGRAATILPPADDWIAAAAVTHGYSLTRVAMNAFGRCADCVTSD